MRLSAIFMTVIGLTVAGGSAYFARAYVEQSRSAMTDIETDAAVIEVVVARQDISFGQAIESHLLTTISWPRESVPAGVYTASAELLPAQGQPPRRARRAISQGELFQRAKVSDYGEKVTIVQSLGSDQRAMAIRVSAETAVGGFVTPGDSVDVVLTQGGGENLRAVTILQNIRVIGVDQDANEQSDAPSVSRTVTVAVSPDEGQRLALAQKAGTLNLTLRNVNAEESEELDLIRLSDILQDSPQEETRDRTVVVRRANIAAVEDVPTHRAIVTE